MSSLSERQYNLLRILLTENEIDVYDAATKIGKEDHALVPYLIEALDEESWGRDGNYIRACAAIALGKIGDPRAIKPLKRFLWDDDDLVLTYVTLSLRQLGWRSTTEEETVLCLTADGRWEEVVKMGPKAIPGLIVRLGSFRSARLRHRAAESLQKLGWEPKTAEQTILHNIELRRLEEVTNMGSAALPYLIKILQDESAGDISLIFATEALVKIDDNRLQPLNAALKKALQAPIIFRSIKSEEGQLLLDCLRTGKAFRCRYYPPTRKGKPVSYVNIHEYPTNPVSIYSSWASLEIEPVNDYPAEGNTDAIMTGLTQAYELCNEIAEMA